jgi:hypothetical protein
MTERKGGGQLARKPSGSPGVDRTSKQRNDGRACQCEDPTKHCDECHFLALREVSGADDGCVEKHSQSNRQQCASPPARAHQREPRIPIPETKRTSAVSNSPARWKPMRNGSLVSSGTLPVARNMIHWATMATPTRMANQPGKRIRNSPCGRFPPFSTGAGSETITLQYSYQMPRALRSQGW